MAGPYADYWIATPNKVLSTTEQTVTTFDAPNVVVGMVGLLQVQVHTESTNGLKAVLRINNKDVFVYGPTSTNMSRMLQAPIPAQTLKVGSNLVEGEVLSGSGTFKVVNMAIHWQAQ
jgi:hypothetical protein